MIDYTPNDNDSENSTAPEESELTYEIGQTETPSHAVVRAVASLTNTAIVDLDPLYDVIDPEHLDELSEDRIEGDALIESSITFMFNGCRVTVTQGTVHVHEHDGDGN